MRGAWTLGVLAALVALAPMASAATASEREAACVFPDVDALCDAAIMVLFDRAFAGYADVALAIVANIVAVALLIGLIHLVRTVKPSSMIRLKVAERVKEVEPGGRVKFHYELENLMGRSPVEVFLERPTLPGYWSAEMTGAAELDSGFRIPQTLNGEATIQLTGRRKGASRAALELVVTAPAESTFEETLDYSLRAVPWVAGRVRKRKARTAKVTVLVTPSAPIVQIMDVAHEPPRVAPGVPVLTRVLVKNRGEKDAADVKVAFMLNGDESDAKFVPSLASGAEAAVEFRWTPQAGENKIRLVVQ
jgi:hypothetical protein